MSEISGIIHETDEALARAKVLLQKSGSAAKPGKPDLKKTKHRKRQQETSLSVHDLQHQHHGNQSAITRSGADRRHTRRQDNHAASHHVQLSDHYLNGLPHVDPVQAESEDGQLSLTDETLQAQVSKLEHTTQRQALELRHMHQAMAAMQSQLDIQRQTISRLQGELLPVLAEPRHGGDRSAYANTITEMQRSVSQLQQDVFNHLAVQRTDEEQRKQRLNSMANQVQWTKDSAGQEAEKMRRETEAIRLTLDRHESQLATQVKNVHSNTTQLSSLQRAIHKAEQAVQSSREDLMTQMEQIRVGLDGINLSLVRAHGEPPSASDSIVQQAQKQYLVNHHRLAAEPAARQRTKKAKHHKQPSRHEGRVRVPQSSRHQGNSGAGRTPTHADRSYEALTSTDVSLVMTPKLSELSTSAVVSDRSSTTYTVDSDFESLRAEDDRLLAELERYATPDMFEGSVSASST